jgi:peptidoglycan/LPS O-acetylase OafA/YrhL
MIKGRLIELDIMRIIGFLMVVDQHILGAYAQGTEASFGDAMILHFLYLLGRPAVPMFIAITGFTLFHVNYNKLNIKEFYIKRTTTILLPYLFWSIASILIFKKYDMFQNLLPVLMTGTASYHLWYMGMSIRLYMWFPIILALINKIAKKNSTVQKVAFVLFCIFFWILFREKSFLVNNLAVFLFDTPSLLEKRFIEYSPIFWSIYFLCGIIIFFRYERFKAFALRHVKAIILTYLPLVLYMYYTQVCDILPEQFPRIPYEHALYILYMLQTTAMVYIISVKVSKLLERYKKYVLVLGELSYGAYLVHVIVLQFIAPVLRSLMTIESLLLSGIIIFIVTSILSFAICYVISFVPLSKYIIGVKRKRVSNVL